MGQENSTNQENEPIQNNLVSNLAAEITDCFVDILDDVAKNVNNVNNVNNADNTGNANNVNSVDNDDNAENVNDTTQENIGVQKNINHSRYWTSREEKDLLDEIDKHTLDELAKIHGRTKGAIKAKLQRIYMGSAEKKIPNTQIKKFVGINNIKNYSITKNTMNNDTLNIYIIKCQHNKYYIGKSKNLENRILEHFQEIGSAWTGLHKPIEVVEIIKNADIFDEDKYTKIYMAKYGIDNVRGGSYVQISLSTDVKKYLEKEINSTYDYCHRCGRADHFINKCYANVHIDGTKLSNSSDKLPVASNSKTNKTKNNTILESPNEKKISEFCTKCGRKGHTKESCYAKKHVKGFSIK